MSYVNNTKEFADEIRNIKLEEGECITSYDVTVLFTSMPVSPGLEIIKNRRAGYRSPKQVHHDS